MKLFNDITGNYLEWQESTYITRSNDWDSTIKSSIENNLKNKMSKTDIKDIYMKKYIIGGASVDFSKIEKEKTSSKISLKIPIEGDTRFLQIKIRKENYLHTEKLDAHIKSQTLFYHVNFFSNPKKAINDIKEFLKLLEEYIGYANEVLPKLNKTIENKIVNYITNAQQRLNDFNNLDEFFDTI